MSTSAFLFKILLKSSAGISPVPGLFTQTFSEVIFSPFLISLIVTTQEYAKSIVGFSSGNIVFEPPSD